MVKAWVSDDIGLSGSSGLAVDGAILELLDNRKATSGGSRYIPCCTPDAVRNIWKAFRYGVMASGRIQKTHSLDILVDLRRVAGKNYLEDSDRRGHSNCTDARLC